MNLAYKYPIIFWNTANLIVDSGSMNVDEEFIKIDNIDDDDNDEEEKIKNSSTDYGKIAAAIGKMKSRGLSFSLPNINKSDITFTPDLENNMIMYGMMGIARIGTQLVYDIMNNRPYSSIEDFLDKIKINKLQMISLIKAGVFDTLYNNDRKEIMRQYLEMVSDKKKRITLQNMNMLIEKDLIPKELEFEKKLFNFNKYIKNFKSGKYYKLNNIATKFYQEHYDDSLLEDIEVNNKGATTAILQTKWDSIYTKGMDSIRKWMKNNQQEILNNLNSILYNEIESKYADGDLSKWEMDSLSFYYHNHELQKLNNKKYEIDDYEKINDSEVERTFLSKNGEEISLYKVHRIAGTVIDKDKNKSTLTLLTTTGVVIVKVWKNQFIMWDKQITEKDMDGKKHVAEKSWFQRGTKLIITGIKRDNTFIPKKYKDTKYPLFEKIIELDDKGNIINSVVERVEVDE